MSKLAHSHQATMDALDTQRAVENGDTDCLTAEAILTEMVRLYRSWDPSDIITSAPPRGYYKLLLAARELLA